MMMRDFHVESAGIHANAACLHDVPNLQITPWRLACGSLTGKDQKSLEWIEALNDELHLLTGLRWLRKMAERTDALALRPKLHIDVVPSDFHDSPAAELASGGCSTDVRASKRSGSWLGTTRGSKKVLFAHPTHRSLKLGLERGLHARCLW